MSIVEKHEATLKSIESGIVTVWRKHPEMANYAVGRAYEAAIAYYLSLAREQVPKPANLTGLDAELFDVVKEACEDCRLRGPIPTEPPISLEDLVACLRKLHKSVDFWTKQGGRQGYMKFIEGFVP
jgi:hypothetical protein